MVNAVTVLIKTGMMFMVSIGIGWVFLFCVMLILFAIRTLVGLMG